MELGFQLILDSFLQAFGENFLAGKLRPYLKSEPIPEKVGTDI